MVRKHKTLLAKLFSLLVAFTLCFTVFTVPVSAEKGDGDSDKKGEKSKLEFLEDVDPDEAEPAVVEPIYENGRWNQVHSNMETFKKNFRLSPELKEYSITTYEKVISDILKPNMSDLEKYYTLAIWLNKYVNYDWNFWPGGYDFDYYSHQWDAYGVLNEKESVCAGIAISYANLCHAADLPCKFIRMKPYVLDHTINYIPNINGHAYYIDVTENIFFMSDEANPWDPMDTEFAHIPDSQIPDDGSFEYTEGGYPIPSTIKDYYDTPFDEWYTEYALHKNTDKDFKTKYEEKGSGTRGVRYARYHDYPKQYSDTEKPGIWFIEDFYEDPATIEYNIRHKVIDGQLLNISGIQGNYDCDTPEELAAAVASDMAVKYFPSLENGEIVAKAAGLTYGTDYIVTCDASTFDLSSGEATITIAGQEDYSGIYQIPVRIHSASVTTVPVNNMDLVYKGRPQVLVDIGEAENGTILYAAWEKTDADELWKKGDPGAAPAPQPDESLFKEQLPTAKDAGSYEVWYKVRGDAGYADLPPQKLDNAAIIAPKQPKILVSEELTLIEGETVKLTPELDTNVSVTFDFVSDEDDIASVSDDGTVTGIAAGTTVISVDAQLTDTNPNYEDPADAEISVVVTPDPHNLLNAKVELSETAYTYNANVQKPSVGTINGQTLKEGTDYTATWSNVSSTDAGTYTVTIEGIGDYFGTTEATYTINKAANPMTVKAKNTKVKRSKLRKKAQTIKREKLIAVSNAQGNLTYQLVSAKKGKKSFKKYFKVDAKSGNVTVKKRLKRGRYKVKVRVMAAGNANYEPSSWQTVTSKVRVR